MEFRDFNDARTLARWLEERDENKLDALFKSALEVKRRFRGEGIYLRGLIEISNICRKNCLYCGIRSGNRNVERYELTDEQVLEEARFSLEAGYGSVVLQGGERSDGVFTERISRLVYKIKKLDAGGGRGLGITLSLGEQSREGYREWFRAGAHRYLLRIESSDRRLYESIHPSGPLHGYDNRIKALEDLKSEGYIMGTGVMIGLPGQTVEHLAGDLLFFKKIGAAMVGMGPYIPHPDTPMGASGVRLCPDSSADAGKLLLSLKMVALLRHLLPGANIAATTALQVLAPDGRERALLAGANVVMPNMTDVSVRKNYQLYSGKSGLEDTAQDTKDKLVQNLDRLGIRVEWNEWGDPGKQMPDCILGNR